MMSDLGKIRAGSQRVYRDRLFATKGQVYALHPRQSADGLVRFVFHPDDIDAVQEEVAEENVEDLVQAINTPVPERWTVFGLPIVDPWNDEAPV